MRWTGIYLRSVASHLPPAHPVSSAIDNGLIAAERAGVLGYLSVLEEPEAAPPTMAVNAGLAALERAAPVDDIVAHFHASLWFQGLDFWPTASYVAARTSGESVPAVDVQQRCNAGLMALELAASSLVAHEGGSAVITTSDRFALPAVDRWSLHPEMLYGDGATAAVVSTTAGPLQLLATATSADNRLEVVTRGDLAFATHSGAGHEPVRLGEGSPRDAEPDTAAAMNIRVGRVIRRSYTTALRDAGIEPAAIDKVVIAASGRIPGDFQIHDLLGVREDQTTWDFARRTGHLGAGDWFAGLENLVCSRTVAVGDTVLLLGGGAGYSCTVAVLRVNEVPRW